MVAQLVLYNLQGSIHAQYARVALDEASATYEKVNVQLPLENIAPEYALISPSMSVPALKITDDDDNNNSVRMLTDSRDIINYSVTTLGGDGEKLFPKDKQQEIDKVLDQIYSANGGQLSFQAQMRRDPIFRVGVNIMAKVRNRTLRSHRDDPKHKDTHLQQCYEEAVRRTETPGPTLEVLSDRANAVMAFLDQKLVESNGPWLCGEDYTVADGVAAVWIQWVVWARAPNVLLSQRAVELLERAKKRPAWKVMDPTWAVRDITNKLYPVAAVAGVFMCGAVVICMMVMFQHTSKLN